MHRRTLPTLLQMLSWLLPLLLATFSPAWADTEVPRVVLGPGAKDLVVGPGMNAAGRDLRGCEFVTQDLRGANFNGCNLYGVLIDGCLLNGASFRRAIFPGSIIEVVEADEVDVTDATINGVLRPSGVGFALYGLGLSPGQLMSTRSYKTKDLRQCRIRASYPHPSKEFAHYDFSGVDLRETRLSGDLTKTDFTDARIDRSHFGYAKLSFQQLASTRDYKQQRLRVYLFSSWRIGADVPPDTWDFSHINLAGSDLSLNPSEIADFTYAKIRDCTIRHGLTKAHLYSTRSYEQGDLSGLQLWSIDLSGCDLSGVNLTGCVFESCSFSNANFDDAVITRGRFSRATDLTVEQIKSTWNFRNDRMSTIEIPSHLEKAIKTASQE
jgi:uncharacterized protein YjbI with pentapeptide repeats